MENKHTVNQKVIGNTRTLLQYKRNYNFQLTLNFAMRRR